VYINQFYTQRPGATGTKHIYAGLARIASKLVRQDTPNSNPNGNTPFEKDIYFFHPDHLGSSNYVTDLNGKLYEHLEYFPFGEGWIEENTNQQRTPFLFTAKELDEETGLYYFGARYYDPRTSVWQSADPILEKYLPTGDKRRDQSLPGMGGVYRSLNLSPYKYAGHNPLLYVDPDGKLDFPVDPQKYRISSHMGLRIDPRNPTNPTVTSHRGTDLATPGGTSAVAVAKGTVGLSYESSSYGNVVVVSHGQIKEGPNKGKYLSSLYAHLSQPGASVGTGVTEGQSIGLTGSTGESTGPHVHFELIVSDRPAERTGEFFQSPRLDPKTADVGELKWGPEGKPVSKYSAMERAIRFFEGLFRDDK